MGLEEGNEAFWIGAKLVLDREDLPFEGGGDFADRLTLVLLRFGVGRGLDKDRSLVGNQTGFLRRRFLLRFGKTRSYYFWRSDYSAGELTALSLRESWTRRRCDWLGLYFR